MIVKKLWSTLKEILGKKANSAPSFIEADGLFLSKPFDIANHFNNFFVDKTSKLNHYMQTTNAEPSYSCIWNQIMKDKRCSFEFRKNGEKEDWYRQSGW
jgi:hypothetical protein